MARVFVNCNVCKAHLLHPERDRHVGDAEFIAWALEQGWAIAPHRCPAHAGEEGTAAIEAGYASKLACTATHDPQPWTVSRGIAMAQAVFSGGGDGRERLSLREGYCQEESHYWLYDHLTVPALAAEVAAGAEPRGPR